MTVLLIGSATGERVAACRTSLEGLGYRVEVCGYDQLLAGELPQLRPDVTVRLESPSDDPRVDDMLVRAGGGNGSSLQGALLDSAAWVRGLGLALQRLDAAVQARAARPLYDSLSVLAMFDKTETRRRLTEVGVPVAPPARLGDPAVFVKARHGSSGAGLLAVHSHDERVSGWTTVGFDRCSSPINVYPRRVLDPGEADRVVTAIAATGGALTERWVPKFTLAGRSVDLRVVVVRGQARQVLARAAAGPITNLHLGAERADLSQVINAVGVQRWQQALATAEQAMTAFPLAHYAGVDLGLDRRGRPFVLEVNAFGDFHTGIVDSAGLDTYAAELA